MPATPTHRPRSGGRRRLADAGHGAAVARSRTAAAGRSNCQRSAEQLGNNLDQPCRGCQPGFTASSDLSRWGEITRVWEPSMACFWLPADPASINGNLSPMLTSVAMGYCSFYGTSLAKEPGHQY